jgi:hypothetical protein
MHAVAIAITLLPILTLAFSPSNPSTQDILKPLDNKHLKLIVFDCNATLPKAPRSDCEALLADLDNETDSDEFFCPQFCRDPETNHTAMIGEMRQHGKCKLQAVTNIPGGDDFPNFPIGCDGM